MNKADIYLGGQSTSVSQHPLDTKPTYTLSNSWKHQTTLAYGQSSNPARNVPILLARWAHPAVATDKTTNLAILETIGVPRMIHRATRDVNVGGYTAHRRKYKIESTKAGDQNENRIQARTPPGDVEFATGDSKFCIYGRR